MHSYQAPWEAPRPLPTTGWSGPSACYWTVASTAGDLFSRWHIFSIHFVSSVQKHRLEFWQRALLTVSVKSTRLAVTNREVKLEGKKEEARLVSLGTFQIFIFCLLKTTSVVRYSLILLAAARNTKWPRVQSRKKKNQCTDFILSHIDNDWLNLLPPNSLQPKDSIYRLTHIYFQIR